MAKTHKVSDRILDKALELAQASSWEQVRLQQVSEALGFDLEEVRRHFRQKDDLAEALFDRADQAVLAASGSGNFRNLCGRDRLRVAIMTWLGVLTPHHRAVFAMLKYKLEPGHIHLQAFGVVRLSRTVQWFLEATCSRTTHLARTLEEIGTTAVFLATVAYWLTDHAEHSVNTNDFLDRLLHKSEALARSVNPDSVITRPAGHLE
ncbi:MAG: TetR/AcrR family transcriptional regulator [Gammaproteobacteria bacterium]